MGKFTSVLRQSDIFGNLNPEQLAQIEAICQERAHANGELITREGAPEGELCLIAEGEVEVSLDPGVIAAHPDGEVLPVQVEVFRRGQSFGEMALLDEGVRSATARASQPTRLLVISRSALLAALEANPALGYQVMFNLAVDLSQKVRHADLRIREEALRRQGGQIV
jgi:CRP-like cAMP-binding protein